jgi:hypothetical protein
MGRFRLGRPTPAMVVAMTALFVALGGTGYAALALPPHSVGKKQLKPNAVTTTKIDDGTLRLNDFKRSELRRLRGGAEGVEGLDGLDGLDGEDGADGATGSALLTGAVGGLPASGTERAPLTGHTTNALTTTAQVATLSPDRELVLRDFSAAAPSGATVTFEVVATPFGGSGEDVVIGCTVTATTRTCTEPGPDTLPANHLIYMRLTLSGGGTPDRVYWGVSAEPSDD